MANLIAEQWNKNVLIRAKQLENDKDPTYKNVLVPSILESLNKYGKYYNKILDFGCGCGHLTNIIKDTFMFDDVFGIDISRDSIHYAASKYVNSGIHFSYIDISLVNLIFDYVIANMVFHSCENIEGIMRNINRVLNIGGHLTFIIPHPQYWLINKGYVRESEFIYSEHKEFSIPSIAHLDMEDIQVFHRPVGYYKDILEKCGFADIEITPLYTKYDNPHIIKFDARKAIDLNIAEKRLLKLHEMISMSSVIRPRDKQPLYVLYGNRLMNNSPLPSVLYNGRRIKIGNHVYWQKKYYRDVIDHMDIKLLEKIYLISTRSSTLKSYLFDGIHLNKSNLKKVRLPKLLYY